MKIRSRTNVGLTTSHLCTDFPMRKRVILTNNTFIHSNYDKISYLTPIYMSFKSVFERNPICILDILFSQSKSPLELSQFSRLWRLSRMQMGFLSRRENYVQRGGNVKIDALDSTVETTTIHHSPGNLWDVLSFCVDNIGITIHRYIYLSKSGHPC